jgi:hypothetical protein
MGDNAPSIRYLRNQLDAERDTTIQLSDDKPSAPRFRASKATAALKARSAVIFLIGQCSMLSRTKRSIPILGFNSFAAMARTIAKPIRLVRVMVTGCVW